ncbi:MAG: hypothetical protein HYZ37_18935 [Candidatus Solibacter usitatus]|nr:hypothetical protein [Candidatus Solibacter usitatus]
MEDRKYRQHGYQDSDRDRGPREQREPQKPKGPRPPIDITGPRLPRLVQSVAASRCWNCATMLLEGTDFKSNCVKCHAPLHCCKQCSHFEPSTRFQCLKPIPVRVAYKDQPNECELFDQRVTVARDTSAPPAPMHTNGSRVYEPRSANDARAAFDNLFKK